MLNGIDKKAVYQNLNDIWGRLTYEHRRVDDAIDAVLTVMEQYEDEWMD